MWYTVAVSDVAYEHTEASLAASGSIDSICLPIKEYIDRQPCDSAVIKQMIIHFVARLPLENACQALYTLAVTCPFFTVDETSEMHGIADSMDLFKANIYGSEQEIRQRLKSFTEAIIK